MVPDAVPVPAPTQPAMPTGKALRSAASAITLGIFAQNSAPGGVDKRAALAKSPSGMDKSFSDASSALHDLFDGATLLAGGFGLCGNPENCIRAIRERGTKNLTIVSNNCGVDAKGLGILLANGQVKKMI